MINDKFAIKYDFKCFFFGNSLRIFYFNIQILKYETVNAAHNYRYSIDLKIIYSVCKD